MAKKQKTLSKPTSKTSLSRKHTARIYLGKCAAIALIVCGLFAAGNKLGRRGLPAARQEGCITGASRLYYNMSGGQEAPQDKVTEFCTAVLSQ